MGISMVRDSEIVLVSLSKGTPGDGDGKKF
jgi:hypothetical protein